MAIRCGARLTDSEARREHDAPVRPMIARAKCAPIRYYCRTMRKRSTAKSPKPQAPRPPRAPVPALNPNLNQQTRRMLGQHYRAKYGVK
jgi:hypothetical protein